MLPRKVGKLAILVASQVWTLISRCVLSKITRFQNSKFLRRERLLLKEGRPPPVLLRRVAKRPVRLVLKEVPNRSTDGLLCFLAQKISSAELDRIINLDPLLLSYVLPYKKKVLNEHVLVARNDKKIMSFALRNERLLGPDKKTLQPSHTSTSILGMALMIFTCRSHTNHYTVLVRYNYLGIAY
jgi:hypothetical protein